MKIPEITTTDELTCDQKKLTKGEGLNKYGMFHSKTVYKNHQFPPMRPNNCSQIIE